MKRFYTASVHSGEMFVHVGKFLARAHEAAGIAYRRASVLEPKLGQTLTASGEPVITTIAVWRAS